MPRNRGNQGVAGDVYPDTETVHPSDPDGDPAGLAPDDTRDTEADPTPNTMEAAEKNPDAGITDKFGFAVEEPPTPNRPGRSANPRTIAAEQFARAHPQQWVMVGIYDKQTSVPERLRVIDGKRVLSRWVPQEDGRVKLHLNLTNEDYVPRKRVSRKTTPEVGVVPEGETPEDQSNEAKGDAPSV